MKVFADRSVAADQREGVKETVAAMLAPILRRDPEFPHMAAVVSYGPKGWDVTVLALDPALGLEGAPAQVGTDLLDAVREALRIAHGV